MEISIAALLTTEGIVGDGRDELFLHYPWLCLFTNHKFYVKRHKMQQLWQGSCIRCDKGSQPPLLSVLEPGHESLSMIKRPWLLFSSFAFVYAYTKQIKSNSSLAAEQKRVFQRKMSSSQEVYFCAPKALPCTQQLHICLHLKTLSWERTCK